MIPVDSIAQAYRATGKAPLVMQAVWISPINRTSRAPEPIGFWQGPADEEFAIDDMFTGLRETRVFHSAPGMAIDDIEYEVGLNVNTAEIHLPGISDEVRQALEVYDPFLAQTQIFRRNLDPETLLPLGLPERRFKGVVSDVNMPEGSSIKDGDVIVEVSSMAYYLQLVSGATRSNEWQHTRDQNDDFRKHAATAHKEPVPWKD